LNRLGDREALIEQECECGTQAPLSEHQPNNSPAMMMDDESPRRD